MKPKSEFGMPIAIPNVYDRKALGLPHEPRSVDLVKELQKIDEENSNYFDFIGGEWGDHNEELMYLLDIYFERRDIGL